jgi:hypothetical protein
VFHEQSSGHWVHGLTVHLLNVLDVRANRNLVSRLDKANVRDDAHLPHFLDSVSYLPLDGGAQACLVSIVKLASIIQELDHHWSVLPVDFLLVDSSHVLLADLSSSERSVDEDRRSLLIMLCKVLLLSLDQIVTSEVSFRGKKRVFVSVFLLVFILNGHHAIVFIPVANFRLRAREIDTNVLA